MSALVIQYILFEHLGFFYILISVLKRKIFTGYKTPRL